MLKDTLDTVLQAQESAQIAEYVIVNWGNRALPDNVMAELMGATDKYRTAIINAIGELTHELATLD